MSSAARSVMCTGSLALIEGRTLCRSLERGPFGGRPTGRFTVPSAASRGLRRLRRRSERTPRRLPALFVNRRSCCTCRFLARPIPLATAANHRRQRISPRFCLLTTSTAKDSAHRHLRSRAAVLERAFCRALGRAVSLWTAATDPTAAPCARHTMPTAPDPRASAPFRKFFGVSEIPSASVRAERVTLLCLAFLCPLHARRAAERRAVTLGDHIGGHRSRTREVSAVGSLQTG